MLAQFGETKNLVSLDRKWEEGRLFGAHLEGRHGRDQPGRVLLAALPTALPEAIQVSQTTNAAVSLDKYFRPARYTLRFS